MPKLAERKKKPEPQPAPTTLPVAEVPPTSNGEVSPAETATVFYDKLDIKERSTASEHGPITVQEMKELLWWETEKEFQVRMCKKNPESKPDHWVYGEDFHCRNTKGEKVRTWNNAQNRPFDENWCKDLVHTILSGQWAGPLTVPGETINGETIRISRYKRVLSGQHQGSALILADEYLANARAQLGEEATDRKYPTWKGKDHPVLETIVITGLSEDRRVLMTIDYCKPRSEADVFYTSDVFKSCTPQERNELCRMLAAALDLLWVRTDARGYKTHPEIVGLLDRHKTMLKCVEYLFKLNSAKAEEGGRRISKLQFSAGQAAGLDYIMASSGPKTEGDTYRNENPPTEKGLDWSYWDKAFEFWGKFAKSEAFLPVRKALGRLMESSSTNDENIGMGGRLSEKLAIICKAWIVFKDHPESAGAPFTEEDLLDDGALSLSYTDIDDKGKKLPDGKVKLLDIADFFGIDSPEVVQSKSSKTAPPAPPPPTQEEIDKGMQDMLQKRNQAMEKIEAVRAKKKEERK